jgi:hypothetical protein
LVALVSELGLGLLLEVGVADDFRFLAGVLGGHGQEGGVLEGSISASIDTERRVGEHEGDLSILRYMAIIDYLKEISEWRRKSEE